MKKIIIAIDGYSACGKSTTARQVASRLGYGYIDTGAMYRATALYFHQHYVHLTNPIAIAKALEDISITFHYNEKLHRNETYLNGLNVEDEIRKMYISDIVSEVSAVPEVRKEMTMLQRKMGKKRGVVMDGRDIGTNVYPDAELKIFMVADMHIRAARRQQELLERKQVVDLDEIIENLAKRDHLDTTRTEGPLSKAEDAYVVDTSFITLEEQTDYILGLATSKIVNSYMAEQLNQDPF
ncbi:MAG: (d)CMP kinase [Cytophagaceae bacterium]|jgi:cytidylate kinase|nr:(d)CMP kinase [Cytophagaceae bacterium]